MQGFKKFCPADSCRYKSTAKYSLHNWQQALTAGKPPLLAVVLVRQR